MKGLNVFLILSVLSATVWANGDYSDNKRIQELVRSGNLTIGSNSSRCPKSYFKNQTLVQALTSQDKEENICVRHIELPGSVAAEVREMDDIQLTNDSDYDRRVTKLYVFEQESFDMTQVDKYGWENLAKVLNIPLEQTRDLQFGAFFADENSFNKFSELHLKDSERHSQLHRFLARTLNAQFVLEVVFRDFEALYPGGGFGVRHHVFVTKTHLVYVKYTYWDA